jgi:hypothetical protein
MKALIFAALLLAFEWMIQFSNALAAPIVALESVRVDVPKACRYGPFDRVRMLNVPAAGKISVLVRVR